MHLAEDKYLYKENANIYLNALSIAIRERYGNIRVNMLLVGGSAIILRHTFRTSTEDLDAYIESMYDITAEVLKVAEEFSIPTDWINSDFLKSKSASKNLMVNANLYRVYNNLLHVYTICDLDLICMKLVAYRDKDKHDLTSLFLENSYITQALLLDRLNFLYGGVHLLSYDARSFVTSRRLPEY